jgi:hypothetical protein
MKTFEIYLCGELAAKLTRPDSEDCCGLWAKLVAAGWTHKIAVLEGTAEHRIELASKVFRCDDAGTRADEQARSEVAP